MFRKFGESFQITEASLQTAESVLSDPEINERFQKFAKELKKIAPKANDFLYFSAVMMHAAEASLLNDDGSAKTVANGKVATANWDKRGESWRWVSNDPSIRPYKNSNGDIFPEEELLKAYKKWVGKPLCIDHKSNSVDFIRGVIVDTYYDRTAKRVIALCALDKVNYPDLARKVSSGYATCVSMGTAVGRAVCSDCGTVARTEHDFCNHMRTKSCYGEINLDLQPIELSIVVNGADPLAKIKHVIASANHLNDYASSKQAELNELTDADKNKVTQIKEEIVDGIKRGLDDLVAQFEAAELTFTTTNSEVSPEENHAVTPEADASIESIASDDVSDNNDALVQTFNVLKSSIEQKLSNIQDDFNKLIKFNTESRDMKMEKKSYYQGTEEPKPGTNQYPAEPLNEQVRTQHSHMKDLTNLGPVDGMPAGELEKKKMLARAQADERAERRKTALEAAKTNLSNKKEAYFQGTEEPKPGKQQYPVDGGEAQSRKDHKHMQGQPPFPGVGAVDGLHPSPASADTKDELKRKEMLGRASLKAKFVKAADSSGDLDRAKSQWQVFANDKLVLSASVDEISAGRSDVLYDVIATRDFGTKMLEKVKEVGFDKAASLYKSAQAASGPLTQAAPAAPEAAPTPAPEAPAADAGAMDMPTGELPSAEDADKGGSGDPEESVDTLLDGCIDTTDELKTKLSDLKEGISALQGEKAEMSDAPVDGMSPATASLQKMRLELNAALIASMTKNAKDMLDHSEELSLIQDLYNSDGVNDSNREYVEAITQDALGEAKQTLAETNELFQAFVKYAKGTEAMMKRAELESSMSKTATGELDGLEGLMSDMPAEMPAEMLEEPLSDEGAPSHLGDDELEALLADEGAAEDTAMETDMGMVEDTDMNDATMSKQELTSLPPGAKLENLEVTAAADFDLSTREGRTAYRAKLAGDGAVKFDPILNDAHKHIDQEHSSASDLAHVETIQEKHKAVLDLAKASPKVRKEAMEIVSLVKAGKLAAADVDQLVAHGVDAEAVAYFKSVWAEVQGGSEFASELTTTHLKAQAEEEMANHKVKIARAYELAYEMVDRGLCGNDKTVIASQVDEIMKYNDEAFDSLKKVVARHAPVALRKEAARIPSVGTIGSGDTFSQEPVESDDFVSSLNRAFANRRY